MYERQRKKYQEEIHQNMLQIMDLMDRIKHVYLYYLQLPPKEQAILKAIYIDKKQYKEIIKEGRKFGTFLTISSQRPSDISDTIISQLHNYFIHRLVNEEDLRKIHRTIAFSDKSTNDMISILPAGGCIFTGLASNFPVLARINILPEANQPRSENVDISKIWY